MEIKVLDMHCSKCVARIQKVLDKENVKATIDLEKHIVVVNDKEERKAKEIILDCGFQIEE